MSDLIIKGMEMPKNCGECKFHRPLYHTEYCTILDKNCSPWKTKKAWCPLLPLPEGHGWLGDLDAIIKSLNELEADFEKKEFFQGACWVHVIAELLKKAPTIIPAEGGGEE